MTSELDEFQSEIQLSRDKSGKPNGATVKEKFDGNLAAVKSARNSGYNFEYGNIPEASESTIEKLKRNATNLFRETALPMGSVAAVNDYYKELRDLPNKEALDKKISDAQKLMYGPDGPSRYESFALPLAFEVRDLIRGSEEILREQAAGAGPHTLNEVFAKPESLLGVPIELASRVPQYLKNKAFDVLPDSVKEKQYDKLTDFRRRQAEEQYDELLYGPESSNKLLPNVVGVAGRAAPYMLPGFGSGLLAPRLEGLATRFGGRTLTRNLTPFLGDGVAAELASKKDYMKFVPANIGLDTAIGGGLGALNQNQTAEEGAISGFAGGVLGRLLSKGVVKQPYSESSVNRERIANIREIENLTGQKFKLTRGMLHDDPAQKKFEALLEISDLTGPHMKERLETNAGIGTNLIKKTILPDGPMPLKGDEFPAFDREWMAALEKSAKTKMEYVPSTDMEPQLDPDLLKGMIEDKFGKTTVNIPGVKKEINAYKNLFPQKVDETFVGPAAPALTKLTPGEYRSRTQDLNRKIDLAKNESERKALQDILGEYENAANVADPLYAPTLAEGRKQWGVHKTAIPSMTNELGRLDLTKASNPNLELAYPINLPSGKTLPLNNLINDMAYISDLKGHNAASLGLGDRSTQAIDTGNVAGSVLSMFLRNPKAITTQLTAGLGNSVLPDLGNKFVDFMITPKNLIGGSPTQVLNAGTWAGVGLRGINNNVTEATASKAYDEWEKMQEKSRKDNPYIYPLPGR